MRENLKKRLMRATEIFSWTVFICLGLVVLYFGNWIFVSDKFIIPSDSMSPTLIQGDRIVVNKLIFGARIYKNLDFSKGQPLESWRMPGLRKIQPNDVLVFNYPHGHGGGIEFKINYIYSKRCVGTPGDTISIEHGFYKNNHYDGIIGLELEQLRLVFTPDSLLLTSCLLYTIPVDSIWTVKEFGPLYVPSKGDTLRLDMVSFRLYESVIEYETKKDLSIVDGVLLLENSPIKEYIFGGNYYFVGGDNVLNSGDSRYWGFVPEEFIVGVAQYIVYSRDRYSHKFRWNRLLKKIDNT